MRAPDPATARAPAPRRARPIARLALVLSGALLALVSVEALARLSGEPPDYGSSMIHDPELGFRSRPGAALKCWDERGEFSFRLNGAGFRGGELPDAEDARDTGVLRLLFVGDSFLYGHAVRDEELVSSATVRELAERSIPAEAHDLGCPDYGTAQELVLLEKFGPLVRPDVVVLLVFPGNDVANNSLELAGCTSGNHRDYLRPYFVAAGEELCFAHPLRAFLRNRLRTFALLESGLLTRASARGWSWPKMWGDLDCPETGSVLQAPAAGDVWDTAWRRTEELLALFRDEVQVLGAELLVLVVPQRNQVQREGLSKEFDASRVAGLDWNHPEAHLQAFFARERIPAVLLLEELRGAIASDPTPVFAQDFHLAARGHALAARAVAGWIEARRAGTELGTAGVPTGMPVDLLAPERCPTSLDFGAAPRLEFLVEGFGTWHPDWSGKGPGVPMAGRAVLVLRAGTGDFFVRGWVTAPSERLPLAVGLAFDGEPLASSLELAEKGAFELCVPRSAVPAELLARTEVTLTVGEASDPRRTLILRAVGFRE